MTAERDDDALLDMLIAARRAVRLAAGVTQTKFFEDEALHVAVTHYIQIIGEAARKVSNERRAMIELPWEQIVGMRNRVVHDYFNVRLPVVWGVLTERLPDLIRTLETLESLVPPEESI